MKRITWTLVTLALASLTAFAAPEKADAPKLFKNTVSLGANLTDGNSDTTLLNFRFLNEGERTNVWHTLLGIDANYGRSDSGVEGEDSTTIENAKAYANLKKSFGRLYGSIDTSLLYDDIALIDYRYIFGPGFGVHAVNNESIKLDLEAGPSYVWEKVDSLSDDYLALRFSQRFTWALSETASLIQTLEYLPRADDFNQYLLNAGVTLETSITSILKLSLALQDKYNSTPADGKEYNDISIVAGLGVSF